MSIAEGVQQQIAYKKYATGAITAGTQPTSSSDPGASGAQIIRRVACTLDMKKDTYQAAEINTSRQITDFRHGPKKVDGSISGELSPGTYWDFIEATCRGTKSSAVVTATQTDFTSMSADNTTSVFTAAGGNPHSKGFRVGDVIRFTNMSDTDNNSKNFVITSLSGSSNRIIGVYPAPDTMTADTTFSVTTVGRSVYVPTSSHVSRKFGIEVYGGDVDVHRFFTECRATGMKLSVPPTGITTCEFMFTGRDMETASGGSSPFFTSPTAATTSGLVAAVNGLVQVNGITQGVITQANIDFNMAVDAPVVVGQNFVADILLGKANVTGQITALFQDLTLLNYFVNETEISLLLFLTTGTSATAESVTAFLPRVKLGGATVGITGEGAQSVTMPFQALQYATAGTGIEATTIRFADSLAT